MTAWSCTTAGAMESGAHTRGRGGQVYPHRYPTKHQSFPSPAHTHLIPSDPTQSPSQPLSPPLPSLSPSMAFRARRNGLGALSSALCPSDPCHIWLKRNQKNCLKTIDTPPPPCGRLLLCPSGRSFPTEDSAVFLMAGLCPLP
jgi:hypothetical protein